MTSHSEITCDFNSAYTVKSTRTGKAAERGAARCHLEIEAKWFGACKPDQKPGDIVMPGGFKLTSRTRKNSKTWSRKQPQ